MGIPAYFRVITQQYKGVLHFSKPCKCDHYFVDFNGVIHQAAQRVLKNTSNGSTPVSQEEIENDIMKETTAYLESCIAIAQPTKMVHTCADGVAPIAKMNQQRKRRYLSVLRKKLIQQQHNQSHRAEAQVQAQVQAKDQEIDWDTNAISPGTAFMTRLDVYLKKHIRENPLMMSNNSITDTKTKNKQNVIIKTPIMHFTSGADECGEGEHKIFSRMASLTEDETAFVYGLDADLIMLSLMSHNKNIYLMREPQHFEKPNTENQKEQSPDEAFIYLNIHALRVALLQELITTHAWPLTTEIAAAIEQDPYCQSAKDVVESYVSICFILGNDFLPHLSTLSLKKNGHNKLLVASKTAWDICGHSPVINGEIQANFFATLLYTLSTNEDTEMFAVNEEYLKKRAYYDPKSSDPEVIQCFALQPKNKDQLAQHIYSISPNNIQSRGTSWRSVYYKHLFHCRMHDTHTVAHACELYIEGIYWTYSYYKRLPKNPKWYYPYNYAPTLLDISNYMQGSLGKWNVLQQTWKTDAKSPDYRKNEFVPSHIQLLSILPRESRTLLPKKYQEFITNPKMCCVHLFPTSYPIQTYLKTHLWECTPILPSLDTDWLMYCETRLNS